MSKLSKQFVEDKALRDSAREVLMADVGHARGTFSAKGIATKVGGRVGDGAKDVFEVAKVHADDKRGLLALLIGAAALFFARRPIMEVLGLGDSNKANPETDELGTEDTGEPALPPTGDDDEQ